MEASARKFSINTAIDDSSMQSPENIALAAADRDSLKHRKKGGVFYTPVSVVDEILAATLGASLRGKSRTEILKLRLLDPACGSGIFLIRALRLFMQALALTGGGRDDAEHVLRCCLYGVDRDPQAVSLAAQLLTACARQYFPTLTLSSGLNIRTGNSLLDPEEMKATRIAAELRPFSWAQNFPEVFRPSERVSAGFDFIVGNPPYGLSRGDQMTSVENKLLQKAFESSRNGKVNKYLAFIALGYRLLGPHGELSFIVPNAWLGISGARNLRALLLNDKALHSITLYDFPVFSDPSVEAVVFRVKKGANFSEITVSHRAKSSAAQRCIHVPVAACLQDAQCKIPLLWDEGLEPLVRALRSTPLKLGDKNSPFLPMIALQAYACGKGQPPQTAQQVKDHCFHSNTPECADAYPYLEGGDIGRYTLARSKSYLRHGKFLAEPQELSRFSGPRVLVREILNAPPRVLSACFTNQTSLYNKSVLHIIAKQPLAEDMMPALCALLNSALISFFIRMCGAKSQRKLFPKVVNEDLRSIPIPERFSTYAAALAKLCELQQAQVRGEIDRQIDALVFECYGVTPEIQRRVARFIGAEIR